MNPSELKTETAKSFYEEAQKIVDSLALLFDRKQQDYGPGNIAAFGEFGVLVRLNDKVERLKNLYGHQRRKPQNESLDDSWRDIACYAIIAILVRKGLWATPVLSPQYVQSRRKTVRSTDRAGGPPKVDQGLHRIEDPAT